MSDKLEACPYCGGEAEYVGQEGMGYWVQCASCDARGPWGDYGYQALAAWNRRTPTPEQAGEVEDNERLIRRLKRAKEAMLDGRIPRYGQILVAADAMDNAIAALQSTPPTQPTADAVEREDESIDQYADRIVAKVRRELLDRIDDDVIGCLKDSHLIFARACAKEAVWTAMREISDGMAALPTMAGDYVMVPREPTRAMWAAGGDAVVGYKQRHHDKVVEDIWSAMLSASPTGGE